MIKIRRSIQIVLILVSAAIITSCNCSDKNSTKKGPVKVELVKSDSSYKLLVNNEPFFIKGAGLEFGNMESLAKHGGNAFRTWRVENGHQSPIEVLDKADSLGLKVCMGIEIARERHGFDYNDTAAVRKQFEQVKKDVLALKNHPALIIWGIGNELNLRYTNPKVWVAVNDIAKMIHKIDPNHPVTTMIAGAEKQVLDSVSKYCPDLDFLSFQLYGDIVNLPKYLKQSNYNGAYLVTEWGATGHWEVPKTSWGQPIENTSTEKAADYRMRYEKVIASDPNHCLGSFVFLWGQKQERTPTWYGIFLENGYETEAVGTMEYLWTGKWPQNKAPRVKDFILNGKNAYQSIILTEGEENKASISVSDPENGKLNFEWKIMREVDQSKKSDGGDVEPTPETVFSSTGKKVSNSLNFISPAQGEYRLFFYVYDEYNNAATANIPFKVIAKK